MIPDPLTGRTGTEEALACLQSANCMPWMPFDVRSMEILTRISILTPQREYYPKDKRHQQDVHWDPNLTTTIQHDAYQPVVECIMKRSEQLSRFYRDTMNHPIPIPPSTVPHLQDRALWRRLLYECPGTLCREPDIPPDLLYAARDRWETSKNTSVCGR